jgi:predicted dehydrogenase
VDAVHLLTGAKYPSSAVALGGTYVWKDGREHPDTFRTILEYPEGFLFDWGMGLGNSAGNEFLVYGTKGTLDLGKDYMTPTELTLSSAGAVKGTEAKAKKIQPDPGLDHMGNWLECLRTRRQPSADIQFGHQHAVATIMAAAALESGRRQKYDPRKREIFPG